MLRGEEVWFRDPGKEMEEPILRIELRRVWWEAEVSPEGAWLEEEEVTWARHRRLSTQFLRVTQLEKEEWLRGLIPSMREALPAPHPSLPWESIATVEFNVVSWRVSD